MKKYRLTVIYSNATDTFEGYAPLPVIAAKILYYHWVCGCQTTTEIW
jgi:hypothetical protein